MKEVLIWTGGQPFLTQRVCSLVELAEENIPSGQEKEWVSQLVQTEVIENWLDKDRSDHLKTIQKYILKSNLPVEELLIMYKSIWLNENIILDLNSRKQEELLIIGIVKIEKNKLKIFNKIYQEIFNLEWIEKNLNS